MAAYSNSFQAGLVLDNASVIGRDPRIRQATARNVASILTGPYRVDRPAAGLYRPLTTLSYMLNYAVFGDGARPPGYHWVNLALHGVNVALTYGLGIVILGQTAPAWALAALWGVHPLLTESVTNVVGRADLLAAFGVLAGLLCYVRAGSAAGRRKWAWLAGMVAAQAAALFSKESGAVLPAILLLYDLAGFGRGSSEADSAGGRDRAPAYGALALPFAAYLYLRGQLPLHMVVPFGDNPLVRADFWTARVTAVKVIGKFLWLYLWPAHLSADYSYNAIPLFGGQASNWENAKALFALVVCLGAAILMLLLAIRQRLTDTPMLFFLGFFFVALAPTANLVVIIGSIMAERFLYLPSLGLAGCVVAAIGLCGRRIPMPGWAALAAVCLALAARTYTRNFDWKDDLSLWTSAADVSPGSAKAHYNLGKLLESVPGRLTDAIAEYQQAIGIDPRDGEAHTNLGNALAGIPGRTQEAIAEYQAASRLEPDLAEAHNNLGNLLARMPGRMPEAIAEFQEALRIRPDNAELHYNLGNALFRMPGRLPEAIAEYQAALRIDPDHVDAHINVGNALSHMPGRLPEAMAEYRAALRIQPDSVGAHIGLANALSASPGRLPEAIAEYRAALRVQPENAEAHYDLGTALANVPGRLPEAIAEYQSALRSEPDLVEAHVNLGNALAQTGQRTEALAEYEAALRIRPDPVVREMADSLRAHRVGH